MLCRLMDKVELRIYPKTRSVILRSVATKNLSFIETVFCTANGAFQTDPSLRFAPFRMTSQEVSG